MNLQLHEDTPFPDLIHIDQLREVVAHKNEIRFMEQPNGLIVACYLVSAEGTFDDKFSRECRGAVFNKNGEIVSRPLHKFFNVNEKEATLVENIDWSKVARVMIKRDGSMIHTVSLVDSFTDGEIATIHACPEVWGYAWMRAKVSSIS